MGLAMNILSVLLEWRARSVTLIKTPVNYLWNPQMDEYWIFRYSARLSAAVNSLVSFCVTCEAQVRVYECFDKCSCKSCLVVCLTGTRDLSCTEPLMQCQVFMCEATSSLYLLLYFFFLWKRFLAQAKRWLKTPLSSWALSSPLSSLTPSQVLGLSPT